MRTAANKRLVRRFYDEVVSTGAIERLDSFVSPDCVETDGQVRVESGIDGMADHVRGVRDVYPDLEITVDRQIAEGEWVASVITARGTHAGEWLGMKPTGEPLVFTGVNVDRVVGGRIVEHGGAANMLVPFMEAGALKPANGDAAAAPPALELDTLTMGPLLRLLLARRGLEPEILHPRATWDVFRTFARIPCPGFQDLTSFQATREPDEGSERPRIPFLYCTLSRQLSGDLPGEGRAVQIQWAVEADAGVPEVEFWSDGFPDLDSFFAAVEGSPQFEALAELGGVADLYVVHLDGDV